MRRLFDRIVALVAICLLAVLLATVTLGVVTRGWGDPLIWTDELSRILMLWLAVFGWVLATRRHAHIRIQFFLGLMPPGLRRATEALIQLALVIFGVLVTIYGAKLVIANRELEATTMPLSMAWFYAPLCLAGAVTATQAAFDLAALRPRPERRAGPLGRSLESTPGGPA